MLKSRFMKLKNVLNIRNNVMFSIQVIVRTHRQTDKYTTISMDTTERLLDMES